MGPRSGDRGNQELAEKRLELDTLQWGRGQVTAEMTTFAYWRIGVVSASMGPRSGDRGNGMRVVRTPGRRPGFNGAAVR